METVRNTPSSKSGKCRTPADVEKIKPVIPGGYILLSRRMIESEVMKKPPLYCKLWVWLLLRASHTDHNGLLRGQLRTSIDEMRKAMAYRIGFRWETPTYKEIRDILDWLRDKGTMTGRGKGTMIVTTKVTHGFIITIENYGKYQDPKSYERHNEGHNDGQGQGHNIYKNGFKECVQEGDNHHPCHHRSNLLEEELPDQTESGGGDALLSDERREKLSPRENKRYIDLAVAKQKQDGGFTKSEAAFRRGVVAKAKKGELTRDGYDELVEWERQEREWKAMDEEADRQAEQERQAQAAEEERRKKEAEERERQRQAEEEQRKARFEEAKKAIGEYVDQVHGEDITEFILQALKGSMPFDDPEGFVLPALKELYPTEYQGAEDAQYEEHKAWTRKLLGLPSPAEIANGSSVCIERKPKDRDTQIVELIRVSSKADNDLDFFRRKYPQLYERAMAEVHHG